jgi:hypothetical protein
MVVGIVTSVVIVTGMILGARNVKSDDPGPEGTSSVIVPTVDIPAGTELSALLDGEGPFMVMQVPDEEVVEGVISDVDQLEGATTTAVIHAEEQIVPSQLSMSGSTGT